MEETMSGETRFGSPGDSDKGSIQHPRDNHERQVA
jgi:hypothetical protein